MFTVRDFNDFSWCLLKKIHDFLNFKEDVILAKKILQAIYNLYNYSNGDGNVNPLQIFPKK